jgi:two-component system nitrogen regulation response regulator NtrX
MSDTQKAIRVLLVDDELDFIQPVSFWLRAKNYDVRTANTGQEALERLQQEVPDIVFLDINMPGMNGIETLRQIRTVHQHLPVIMVTASYQNETYFRDANSLGISGFFPKSSSLTELATIIDVSLRAHAKRRLGANGGDCAA